MDIDTWSGDIDPAAIIREGSICIVSIAGSYAKDSVSDRIIITRIAWSHIMVLISISSSGDK